MHGPKAQSRLQPHPPPHPPAGNPDRTRGSTSHLRKRNLGHRCPGLGFFSCQEIRSPLHPAAAESGARGGGGGSKSQPLPAAQAGSELAEAQLPPRGLARPGTKHSLCPPPRKGPAWGCRHRGLGQDRPGDARLARPPPGARSRLGPGDSFEVEGRRNQTAGAKNRGRAGQAHPAAGTERMKAQSWRLTAPMAQQGPRGAPLCRGRLPDLGERGELTRPDHPPTPPVRARECHGQEYGRARGRQGRHVC